MLKHKRLFILLVVIFFLAIGISTLCRGGIGPPPRRTDLTVFLRAAEAIKSGENIYTVTNERCWHYVYTPLLAILLVPFTGLPLLVNTSLLYMLSAAALCGAVLLSARLGQNGSAGLRAAIMAMLFCIPSLVESMTRGQLGAISVFLSVAILYLYMRGRPIGAGALFAFSVVLKMSPSAPIIIFFLAKREWKAVIAALAGVLFFGWAFPSLVIGADRNWAFLTEWNRVLNHALYVGGDVSRIWRELATPWAWDNQSLYAVFTRWIWPTETASAIRESFLIRKAVLIFGGAILFALAFVSRRKKPQASPKRLVLEYSLFSTLMLLVSPVSEIHHYANFFVLFLAAFLYLDELPKNSVPYQSLMWGSIIAGLTQILCYVKPFGMWGLPAIGALIFWCASFIFLLRPSRRDLSSNNKLSLKGPVHDRD